jgi:hypothetical protein
MFGGVESLPEIQYFLSPAKTRLEIQKCTKKAAEKKPFTK